jgi:hypothetical protein
LPRPPRKARAIGSGVGQKHRGGGFAQSNLENGKANPTLGLLVQLAGGLNCTVPDLLEGS